MSKTLSYGQRVYYYGDYDSALPCTPSPVLKLRPVGVRGMRWIPQLGDRTLLLLIRRRMPKTVSFARAYAGWRQGGAREEHELGEGRAFLRWLQRHELGIAWTAHDMVVHPYFTGPAMPWHDPQDETAQGLSFAIAPVTVTGRKVKLYVSDADILRLLSIDYGDDVHFLSLVERYVAHRHRLEHWNAPAPTLLDWLVSQGKKPLFLPGEMGFKLSL